MSYTCDRCSEPATVVQAKYRGNSNDRFGPTVLYRCDAHKKEGLQTDPLPVSS